MILKMLSENHYSITMVGHNLYRLTNSLTLSVYYHTHSSDVPSLSFVACAAVDVSFYFKPSVASTKEAQGHFAKRSNELRSRYKMKILVHCSILFILDFGMSGS